MESTAIDKHRIFRWTTLVASGLMLTGGLLKLISGGDDVALAFGGGSIFLLIAIKAFWEASRVAEKDRGSLQDLDLRA